MIFINLQSKTHPIRHHHRETHGISANLKIDGFRKVIERFWEVLGRLLRQGSKPHYYLYINKIKEYRSTPLYHFKIASTTAKNIRSSVELLIFFIHIKAIKRISNQLKNQRILTKSQQFSVKKS